jgi:hypothetical protein
MPLSGRHPAQIEYPIVVHQARIVSCVLLGNAELWNDGLGGSMQGCQRCMLLSLGDHHL